RGVGRSDLRVHRFLWPPGAGRQPGEPRDAPARRDRRVSADQQQRLLAVSSPFISFLTDFGERATARAVCRGVMWNICPDARILDLTHEVTAFSFRVGAFLLLSLFGFYPLGVHVESVYPCV